MAQGPKISVVTAVRNGEHTILDCIRSVQEQQYAAEHVFVDGLSTDGTLEIIRRNAKGQVKVISEKDSGIYDAMNKGLSMATGDVIGTLNADDFYASNMILDHVAGVFQDPNVDCCYGDLVYVDPNDTTKAIRYWRSGECSDKLLYRGWMPAHPTFFVRRGVYEKYGLFRTDLGSAADYELTLRFLLKCRITFAYIPELMVIMRAGGASNATWKNRLMVNVWVMRAWKINGLKPKPWTLPARLWSKFGQYLSRNEKELIRLDNLRRETRGADTPKHPVQ